MNTAEKKPKYLRVVEHLRLGIESGQWSPGEMLPIESELAASLGMARNTVRQGLSRLEQDGVIERVQGRGTFVTTPQQRHSRQQLDMFALIADQLREGFYPSLIQGFQQRCTEVAHQAIIGCSRNDIHVQADLILQMIDQNVAGVALVPATSTPTPVHHVRQLQKHFIPIVFCHRAAPGVSAPCITWSGRHVGRLAGEAFLRRGRSRVTFITPHRSELADAYAQGLGAALAEADVPFPESRYLCYGGILPDEHARPAVQKTLRSLYESPDRPDAVFCGSIPDAELVYLTAQSMGWRIPEELSLLCFSGTWRNGALAEQMACVVVDEQGIGAKAAEILHEIRGGRRAIDDGERIVFDVELLEGETL